MLVLDILWLVSDGVDSVVLILDLALLAVEELFLEEVFRHHMLLHLTFLHRVHSIR